MFQVKNPGLFAAGLGMLAGPTPQEGFSNAMQAYSLADQVKLRRQQQAMAEQKMAQQQQMLQQQQAQQQAMLGASLGYLKGKIPEDQFRLAQANPEVRLQLLKQFVGGQGQDGVKFGLNPVVGTDAEGNPAMVQLHNQGGAKRVELPEGFNISNKPLEVDTGTEIILLDQITRQPIGRIPKNLAEAEAQKVAGKQRGQAQAEYNSVIEQADQSIALIDQMLTHPGRQAATGLSSWNPLNSIPGTSARDFNVMGAQLQGKAFLEAFESLKGGGQITEIEGRKATEAIARLDTSQSEQAYKAALMELRSILEAGKRRAAQRAGMGGNQQPSNTGARRTQSGVTYEVLD